MRAFLMEVLTFGLLLAVVALIAFLYFPQAQDMAMQFGKNIGLFPDMEPLEIEPSQPFSPDSQKYFQLKNLSCKTLTRDFLIVTEDVAGGELHGLIPTIPEDQAVAEAIVEDYKFNKTTRTYKRRDFMKRVIESDGEEATTIWKDGRFYQCEGKCTMRLMTNEESEEYSGNLSKIKINCQYFGKTQLPSSVSLASLLEINYTGTREINEFNCENFHIRGNKAYARSVLNTTDLNEEQKTLLWAIIHFEGPVEECLSSRTGVIVFRNLTLDLSDSYRFNYTTEGYMHVNQQTTLTYFTDNVPWSFFGLPE